MSKTIKTTVIFESPLEHGESVEDFISDTKDWLQFTGAPFAHTAIITAVVIDEEGNCPVPSTASSAAI